MHRRILVPLLLLLAAGLAVTLYYCVRQDRGGSAVEAAPGPSGAMVAAMHRMHEEVNRTAMTGDLDRDFVALMIPHHQSAVDMARIYLEKGRDPQLRRLAEAVVASQQMEIEQMRARGSAPAENAASPPGHSAH